MKISWKHWGLYLELNQHGQVWAGRFPWRWPQWLLPGGGSRESPGGLGKPAERWLVPKPRGLKVERFEEPESRERYHQKVLKSRWTGSYKSRWKKGRRKEEEAIKWFCWIWRPVNIFVAVAQNSLADTTKPK